MKNQSIGLQILGAVEVIVSARILLFTIPVFINKGLAANFFPIAAVDWFIMVLTLVALLYLVVGITSIMGYKFWTFFHYLAAVLVFVMTAGLYNLMISTQTNLNIAYSLPVFFSLIVTICAVLMRNKIHKVSNP